VRGLSVAVLVILAALSGCARRPLRSARSAERPDASADRDASAAAGDGAGGVAEDPAPADPCDPAVLLPTLPRDVPGWTLARSPVFPYERFAGVPVGFVGRLFRRDRACAVVAAARPADAAAALEALAEEHAQPGRLRGRPTFTRAAPEANQATTWVLDGGSTLFMVRIFGATDPEALRPFLDALPLAGAGADGGTGRSASPVDAGVAGCPTRDPFPDAFDPRAFYGPPGDCWL
jgi:hypothetical protein